MTSKINSFMEYLIEKKYKPISNIIKNYFSDNTDIIEKYLCSDVKKVYNIEIEDLDFKTVHIESNENDYIEFHIAIVPEISFTVVSGKYDDRESESLNKIWLTVSCSGKVADKLEDFTINYVEQYNKSKSKKPLDGNLIPIIPSNKYSEYAEEIINKLFPQILKKPMKLDVEEFASRLGIGIIKRRITKDHSIFGQIYFEKAKNKFYNFEIDEYVEEIIPKNTIVVDDQAAYLFSFGSYNTTIIHECLHFILHKKAFKFARMINNDFTLIQCQSTGGLLGVSSDSETKWMEIQANGITPFVLVPTRTLKMQLDELLSYYSLITDCPIDFTELLVKNIADFFGVTIYAARKRLIDIGYENAIGVYNWVDNHYIPPYFFSRGSLRNNETYTFSFKEIVSEFFRSSELFTLLYQGDFIFVENHLCINNEKYITIDDIGNLKLSEYARLHLDECCLKFSYKVLNSAQNNESDLMCYLCRDCSKDLTFQLEYIRQPNKYKGDELKSKSNHYNEGVNKVRKDIMFKTIPEILKYLLNYFNMQVKELDIDSGLSDRTISRYLNGENKIPDKRTMIALCCGFKLPPKISEVIMQQAQITFANNNSEDDALLFILSTMYTSTPHQINEYLISCGFKPLTENH